MIHCTDEKLSENGNWRCHTSLYIVMLVGPYPTSHRLHFN